MIGSDIPYTAGRKARRRTQAIAKRYAFHANVKILLFVQACFLVQAFTFLLFSYRHVQALLLAKKDVPHFLETAYNL